MGLLGALGGLGAGLTQVGNDMYKRRERALEEARLLAKEQREQAFRAGENQLDRDATAANTGALIADRQTRTEQNIKAKRDEKAEERKFKISERQAKDASQRELVKLRATLERSNEEAAKRLSDQLSADDVHAVQYGEIGSDGRAEVFTVRKNGSVVSTGKRMRPPRSYQPYAEDEEDDGL